MRLLIGSMLSLLLTAAVHASVVDPAAQDAGVAIAAAFQACAGTSTVPAPACVVQLAPQRTYRYSAAIVLPNSTSAPFVVAPTLDCQGSTLEYTGAGEALTVLGENHYKSGEIRNCTFSVTNPAATATFWSRLDFSVRHSTFNLGASGVTFLNARDITPGDGHGHGGIGYTEENHWDDVQIGVAPQGCGLRFKQDPSVFHVASTGSFFYNTWTGLHFDFAPGSRAVCLEDSPEEPVWLGGNTWVVNVNVPSSSNTVFWLGQCGSISRGTVVLHGEAAGGYDVYASSPCSTFQNMGESYAVGLKHGYGKGVPRSNVSFEGGPSAIESDVIKGIGIESQTHESGGTNPGRICKTQSAGSNVFALASFDPGVDCFFEVGYRITDNLWPDVDVAGASGHPFTSILWTDNFSRAVGIGPGFGAASLPLSTAEVRGTLAVRDPVLGTAADGGASIRRSIDPATGAVSDTITAGAPGQPGSRYRMLFRDYVAGGQAVGLDCFAGPGVQCTLPRLALGTAIVALHTPASAHEPCVPGQFADDASFHYVCVAPDTWKRAALSSF